MNSDVSELRLTYPRSKAYKHSESSLAVEQLPKFASKYGDPTHPTVTTSHIGRMSNAMSKETLEERQARKRAKAMQSQNSGGRIKRVLQTVSDLTPIVRPTGLWI